MYATILLTTLTTLGSLCATLLSTPLGPFLAILFPRALDITRNALGGESGSDHSKPRSSPWVRLSVMRLIGVVPWSGINIACGVCGVSLMDCLLGTFIGCLPWTAVTCQVCHIIKIINNYFFIIDIRSEISFNPSLPNPHQLRKLFPLCWPLLKLYSNSFSCPCYRLHPFLDAPVYVQ